jgi:hypothetical protein
MHGTGVYSAGVGPKGPALERFLDIKKKIYIYIYIFFFFLISQNCIPKPKRGRKTITMDALH